MWHRPSSVSVEIKGRAAILLAGYAMFHFKPLQFHSHVNLLWFAVDLARCRQKKLQCSPWWAKARHVPNPWFVSQCAFIIIADAVAMSAWIRNMASSCQSGWGKSSVNICNHKKLKLIVVSCISSCWVLQRTGKWEMSLLITVLWNSDTELLKSGFFKKNYLFFLCAWHKKLHFSKDNCSWFWKLDLLKKSHWRSKLWAL